MSLSRVDIALISGAGLLVVGLVAAAILLGRGDVNDALSDLPEDWVVVQIDLGEAWDHEEGRKGAGPVTAFEILSEHVVRGDPGIVVDGWANRDDRVVAVRFEGYWPGVRHEPTESRIASRGIRQLRLGAHGVSVLRADGFPFRSELVFEGASRFTTEVHTTWDIEDAGTWTYVLGPPQGPG